VPIYRNLWQHIRKSMPKVGRAKGGKGNPLALPNQLQTALYALYGHYEKTFEQWDRAGIENHKPEPSPLFDPPEARSNVGTPFVPTPPARHGARERSRDETAQRRAQRARPCVPGMPGSLGVKVPCAT